MTSGFDFTPLELSLYLFKTSRRRVPRRKVIGYKEPARLLPTMSPGVLASERTFTVKEMKKTVKEKHNFGAIINDLDLNKITGMCNPKDAQHMTSSEKHL